MAATLWPVTNWAAGQGHSFVQQGHRQPQSRGDIAKPKRPQPSGVLLVAPGHRAVSPVPVQCPCAWVPHRRWLCAVSPCPGAISVQCPCAPVPHSRWLCAVSPCPPGEVALCSVPLPLCSVPHIGDPLCSVPMSHKGVGSVQCPRVPVQCPRVPLALPRSVPAAPPVSRRGRQCPGNGDERGPWDTGTPGAPRDRH